MCTLNGTEGHTLINSFMLRSRCSEVSGLELGCRVVGAVKREDLPSKKFITVKFPP